MNRDTQDDKRNTKTGKTPRTGKMKLSSRFVINSYRGERKGKEEEE